MNTAPVPMYEWNAIPWAKAEREVFKLQKRIYQASQRANRKAIHQFNTFAKICDLVGLLS